MKPVAIFRFSPSEGPAYFADWLDRHAVDWRLIAVDEGVPVPLDPLAYSGIGMMGGPMSATDPLPWIEPLSRLLRSAVAQDVPVIGHCLGSQLLAQALGARVRRTAAPEIGWIDVEAPDPASRREWFGGRESFTAFQWHYEVFDLPPGATRVLTNAFNPNQAYVIGNIHMGLQCHVEMTPVLVESWCDIAAAEIAAPVLPSLQSRGEILRDLQGRIAALQTVADVVYARWAHAFRH
ncbi:MAG: type 1 glutamine amidotransferase [Betaproteobacteria bacterium]|nr:type 1 glutamine amidotransferase [Betaproteobacteria bacterium]